MNQIERIKELLYENNSSKQTNKTILSEGALAEFMRKIFGSAFKSVVTHDAEMSMRTIINDLAKSKKEITLLAIRNHASWNKSLISLVDEAARTKFKMTFADLAKANKIEAEKIIKDISQGMKDELSIAAKEKGVAISKDVTKSTKEVTNITNKVASGGATKAELNVATKNLTKDVKLATKIADGKKIIQTLKPDTVQSLLKKIQKESKVTTGTGPTIGGGVKGGTTTVSTSSGIFKMTKDQIMKLPGQIRKYVVNNKIKSSLMLLGGIGALYYLYQQLSGDDSVILVDESGNEIQDTGGNFPCIDELVKNKKGTVVTSASGEISVQVITTEYPKGLQFYPDGKVFDPAGNKYGKYTCKEVAAVVKENRLINEDDAEVDKDVETMIDLLDFPVTGGDLQSALTLLQKYVTNGKGKEFLTLYQNAGMGGGSLQKSLKYITTINASSVRAKTTMLGLIGQIESGATTDPNKDNTTTTGGSLDNINITWDGKDDGGGGGGGGETTKKKKSIYHDCSKKDVNKETLEFGCKSDQIKEMQKCLGMEAKYQTGNFGPITKAKLGVDLIDKALYDKTIANCKTSNQDVVVTKSGEKFCPFGHLQLP